MKKKQSAFLIPSPPLYAFVVKKNLKSTSAMSFNKDTKIKLKYIPPK